MPSKNDKEKRLSGKEMVNAVLHEIRNPLSTIKMNLELIKGDMKDFLTPREKVNFKRAEIAIREIERINNFLNDFNRFTFLKKVEKRQTDINAVLKDIADSLEFVANNRGITILRDFDLDIPKLQCDSNLLKLAIYNIVLNAIQASGVGGSIVILSKKEDGVVVIKISDTGMGIDEKNYDKIFGPFFTTKSNGSGLGLAIAKRIIDLHNGKISFESKLHKGTTFIIRLVNNESLKIKDGG